MKPQLNTTYHRNEDWFEQGKQKTWSSSDITALQKCRRYYYYKVLEQTDGETDSVHLVFGGLFSASVELYYRLIQAEWKPYEALREVVTQVLVESAKADSLQFHATKTRYNLIRTIVDYFDKYSAYDRDNVKSVEQPFTIPIAEFEFKGKLDLIKEDSEGKISIFDQKTTTASLNDTWAEGWTPNNQVSMYLYAGNMVFTDPIKYLTIDGVSIKAGKTEFGRFPIYRTETQLEEWAEGVFTEIRAQANYDPTTPRAWAQNPNACGYFSKCEYRKKCALCPSVR